MTEQQVSQEYRRLLYTHDDSVRLNGLRSLRESAEKAGLGDWCHLIDVRIALAEKRYDDTIAGATTIAAATGVSPEIHAWALITSARAQGDNGKLDKAIQGYTQIIDNPTAPSDVKVMARVNRGITLGGKGETNKAIADCSAVIEDSAAPPDEKSRARVNRGWAFGMNGETDKAIADYSAVIEDPAAPPEQKARARISRGVAFGKKGENDKAIRDYSAVTDDPAAPSNLRSRASMAKSLLQSPTPKAAQALEKLSVTIDRDARQEFMEAIHSGKERKTRFFSESQFDPAASFLLVLREYNSYTPAIPDKEEPSRGGGYFFKHFSTGVVVDPGFDFLEMFAEAGGRIQDIDHIVITHAHNDHMADLDSLLMLLHEFNDDPKNARKKKVNLYLSQGASKKFHAGRPLDKCNYLRELFTMNRTTKDNPQVLTLAPGMRLHVLPAYHDDVLSSEYAVGLGFEFTLARGDFRRILITSDTAIQPAEEPGHGSFIHTLYPPPFSEPGKVDLLIAHIGSIQDYELTDDPLGTFEAEGTKFILTGETYHSHLGLKGTFFIIHALQPRAALVSEFGEEMKGIWIKAVRAIGKCIEKAQPPAKAHPIPVFAGDPVVIYNIQAGHFLCHEDLKWRDPDDLKMVGIHDPARWTQATRSRPYLFPKKLRSEDQSDFEDMVKRFHTALKDHNLPHFKGYKPLPPANSTGGGSGASPST